MDAYAKQLVEKWKEIIDYDERNVITNPRIREATAKMLENQERFAQGGKQLMTETTGWGSTTATTPGNPMDPNNSGYSGNAEFHKIAIPMVRRTFPNLIAHELVGVQPLSGPVGIAFAMRFIADQSYDGTAGTEIGYNTIDPYYSGSPSLSAGLTKETGEALGSNAVADVGTPPNEYPGTTGGLGIGTGQGIREVSMTIEKDTVEAKTRKLRARWSIEVAQDIQAMHGLTLEDEMMDVLSYEITAEIDRELMSKIRTTAASNAASTTWSYTAADGRWESEKYRNLYNLVIRKANKIAIDTRRGAGNYVVASPDLSAILESTADFSIAPVDTDINTAVTGVSRLGSLGGRLAVYRDTFAETDDLIVGYKGASEYDTGLVYLPYVQLMPSRATFEDSFQPTAGLLSRYAIHEHLFGASYYYIRIVAQNLTYQSNS